ncbi:hypothetical protein ASPVEDRAFT_45379 [Aspergillus versicolor CBS 583.65]|uniref:Zn(2)-C6 fungal-type domain-containing protein n=1 Tax=Aspergillus versicolor CBS 583.65 TaxID=1036611 RepID=A0A1L9PWN2_ASPVE|nr:uncharacterized protein ASPVEDRAFT_45379 [Aspergillus versicolor CBS 583.65]OJJ05951.1 hypothetical protein ASPVEDRAFT_45379 [Aspergillus versicolor CBS 583.65]
MATRIRKTRASTKACHSCRRRKVRCQFDSGMPKCRACYRRSSLCIPSMVALPQLEAEPTAFDPFADVLLGLPSLAETAHLDTALSPLAHQLSSAFDPPPDTDPFSLLSCFALPRSLVSHHDSTPLSIFSREGKEWLAAAAGTDVLDSHGLSAAAFGADTIFGSPSPLAKQFVALPPKDIARSLLQTYFAVYNSFCPTFQEEEFMLWFELEYPIGPESSAAWACLNATFALASLLDEQSQANSWLFWKNATLSWESFVTQAPSLCSAQALLTMTLYLLGTFHSNPSSTMISMAVRMLSGISSPQASLSQQFQLVRMVTQSLDLDHALQVGVPPTELGAVQDIAIPDYLPDPNLQFDCYPSFCRLLGLKEQVYRQLYSITAQDKDEYEAIAAVGQLDSQLEQWKSDIPEKYRPGHPKARDTIEHGPSPTILHLHLSYYYCVLVIHRRLTFYRSNSKAFTPFATSHIAHRSPNPRALISTRLCADAARASLRMVKCIPKENPLVRGLMLYYVVFALKLLVTHTIQDPSSPRARADVLLMRNLEDVLSTIPVAQDERSTRNLIDYCTHHRDAAEQAINDALARRRPKDYDGPREGHVSSHVS